MAWSFAALQCRDAALLSEISLEAQAKALQFAPRALAGLAWAIAALRLVDEPLLDVLAK